MDLATIIGFSGAAIVLLAFVMNQRGEWSDKHIRYDAANAIGSSLLIVSALMTQTWHFLVLNLVWAAVSIRDILVSSKSDQIPPQKILKPGEPSSAAGVPSSSST